MEFSEFKEHLANLDLSNFEPNILEDVTFLLKHATYVSENMLRRATQLGHEELVQLYLLTGIYASPYIVQIAVINKNHALLSSFIYRAGDSADIVLEWACFDGNLDVVKLLIKHGAYVTSDAIKEVVQKRHAHIAEFLIEAASNPKSIRIASHRERILNGLLGSPLKSVKNLKIDNKKHLPVLLQRLFSKTKQTPYNYLLTCPDWHKPDVMDIISTS